MRTTFLRFLRLTGCVATILGTGGCGGSQPDTELPLVKVERGSVIRKAIAVGNIEVEHEVPVKSSTGGILAKLFVELGQEVTKGSPIAEVQPVITDADFLSAERALQAAKDDEISAEEYLEGSHPAAVLSRWLTGQKSLERTQRQASLARKQTEEQLELLRQGKVHVGERALDYVVRAPISGHVLDIVSREGAPVVPSSSFGSGVVLVVLADLDSMLFRGTVDEIDVGLLREGMEAQVRIGALPGKDLRGKISEIALKSETKDNATLFHVRLTLEAPKEFTLRSGYSAVAEIEVDRRDDVLLLPERVVRFQNNQALVRLLDKAGDPVERIIETGLSDGLILEVTGGLKEGDAVLELD